MNRGATALRCTAPREIEGRLGDLLDGFPILGCEIVEGDADAVGVVVYVEAGREETVEALRAVLEAEALGPAEVSRLGPRDWLAPYRSAARPFPVGRTWWIDPNPNAWTGAPTGRVRLALEPRSAFGSGTHESTQLILVELEAMDLEGRSVLDVGTGSGVLSLAAIARGGDPVVGIDIDPVAAMVARETRERQGWARRPLLAASEMGALANEVFDVVVCNIISTRLIPLLSEIRRVGRRGGEAVLSGLLVDERKDVLHRLEGAGLVPTAERSAGEWLALRVVHD